MKFRRSWIPIAVGLFLFIAARLCVQHASSWQGRVLWPAALGFSGYYAISFLVNRHKRQPFSRLVQVQRGAFGLVLAGALVLYANGYSEDNSPPPETIPSYVFITGMSLVIIGVVAGVKLHNWSRNANKQLGK